MANAEVFICRRGCRVNLGDSTLAGEHAFENRSAIHSALMFNLAPAGDLAAAVVLDPPLQQFVDACLLLGAAHDNLLHANSVHSPGKS